MSEREYSTREFQVEQVTGAPAISCVIYFHSNTRGSFEVRMSRIYKIRSGEGMDSTEKKGCKIIKMRISTKRFDGHRGGSPMVKQNRTRNCTISRVSWQRLEGIFGEEHYISDNFEISPCFCGLRVSDDKAEIGAWLTRLWPAFHGATTVQSRAKVTLTSASNTWVARSHYWLHRSISLRYHGLRCWSYMSITFKSYFNDEGALRGH